MGLLTAAQSRRIWELGTSFHHDARIMSLVHGEPHLELDLLRFYDGRVLTISGYPLTDEAGRLQERVKSLAQASVSHAPVELISVWSAERVNLSCLRSQGFRLAQLCRPRAIGGELMLDCRRAVRTRAWHRSPGVARRQHLSVKTLDRLELTASHIKLIENFYCGREVTPYLFNSLFSWPGMLAIERIRWIEAYQHNLLCGLAAIHDAFASVSLGLVLIRDPRVQGVADVLMHRVVASMLETGRHLLNLGSSPSEGHWAFKKKWGAQSWTPPYYYLAWARGELGMIEYSSWPARLIGYNYVSAAMKLFVQGADGRYPISDETVCHSRDGSGASVPRTTFIRDTGRTRSKDSQREPR